MKTVAADVPFTFTYPTFDENAGLYVAAKIYNCSSGAPVFMTTVPMTFAEGGYSGNFTPVQSARYLVIRAVFQDAGFTTVDPTRSAIASSYICGVDGATTLDFSWGAFDQTSTLTVQGNVYDMSSGAPVAAGTVAMTHVAYGIYFGTTTGVNGKTYSISSLVYTGGVPDLNWTPGADNFQCYLSTPSGSSSFSQTVRARLPEIVQVVSGLNQSEIWRDPGLQKELKQRLDPQPELHGQLITC